MVVADTIRVWVRSLGNSCRIRVEGLENTKSLVERLAQSPLMAGLESVDIEPHGSTATFHLPHSARWTLADLETEIAQIPGVRLMNEPESI